MALVLKQAGYPVHGFQGVVHGTVPISSGLSSSASLESAVATLLEQLGGFSVDPLEKAKLCQQAENTWAGVNCGILDQYTAILGERSKAILLDCRSLTHKYVELPGALRVVICNTDDWDTAIDNHFVKLGHSTGFVEHVGNDRYRDPFGVIWNRSIEKDIGNIEGVVLPGPTLDGYTFPDPEDDRYFRDIPEQLERYPDCFRVYCIGFSLYERAWTIRGMDDVLMDFYENPQFLHDLLDAIADYNVARIQKALEYDIDAVYFGDDWGQQSGLIMGPKLWREFIRPRLARMYNVAKSAGKYQTIHSCGDIHQLIDDLIDLGVDMINPFQPEAMDVDNLLNNYRGKVSFHGGLSTQRTLPLGTTQDVREETRHLLELGAAGSYVFAPAHAVDGDTPLENMLAFLDEIRCQPGYREVCGTAAI